MFQDGSRLLRQLECAPKHFLHLGGIVDRDPDRAEVAAHESIFFNASAFRIAYAFQSLLK